jgi:hypothetical protein
MAVLIAGLYKRAMMGDPSAVKLYLEILGESPASETKLTGNAVHVIIQSGKELPQDDE